MYKTRLSAFLTTMDVFDRSEPLDLVAKQAVQRIYA